eukprot:2982116-Prymnesium_polylepis.1
MWCGHRMGCHSRYGPPFVCAVCALIARCVCAPQRKDFMNEAHIHTAAFLLARTIVVFDDRER